MLCCVLGNNELNLPSGRLTINVLIRAGKSQLTRENRENTSSASMICSKQNSDVNVCVDRCRSQCRGSPLTPATLPPPLISSVASMLWFVSSPVFHAQLPCSENVIIACEAHHNAAVNSRHVLRGMPQRRCQLTS